MPIYDLICTSCGYEKGDTMFSSYESFKNAEKERECPACHSKLEAKLTGFSVGGKVKTTGGKIIEKYLMVSVDVAKMPCGCIGVKDIHLSPVTKVKHDPEMN